MNVFIRDTPRWVWCVIAALAPLQPTLGLWLYMAPPEGTVATGLTVPDSALFLYGMDAFDEGFASAYATCRTAFAQHDLRYFAVPHLWLYVLLGWLAHGCGVNAFLFYQCFNGLAAGLYLFAAHRLLRILAPRQAGTAFLLFALSGGPGGVLYVLSSLLGWHAHPAFDAYFFRFGVYELMEGPHLLPACYFPRAYYTLSLAGCYGGLGAFLSSPQSKSRRTLYFWAAPLFAAGFLDARFGLVTVALGALALLGGQMRPSAYLLLAVPLLGGVAAAYALLELNPVALQNHIDVGSMAMWFSPFLVAAWLHLLLAARPVRDTMAAPNPGPRMLLAAGLAYLAAYTIGYFAYQIYYGNLLAGNDGSVAAAVSDWALLGAVAGVIVAWRLRGAHKSPVDCDWCALWLVGGIAVSLSGFGQGWFLRFGPQRLEVFLWLPLCLFVARGVASMKPWHARLAMAVLLGCGTTSIVVGTMAFQGPWGRADAAGPYPGQHTEIMRAQDAAMLELLGDGMVAAPPPMSDIIVLRRGNPVVFGIGSFNLTDQRFIALRSEQEAFFAPDTPAGVRLAFVEKWCVDYVFCPATWPVAPGTLGVLRALPWLKEVSSNDGGAVFEVLRPR